MCKIRNSVITTIIVCPTKYERKKSTHTCMWPHGAFLYPILKSVQYMSSSVDHTHHYVVHVVPCPTTEGVLCVVVCRCGESVDRLLLKNLLSMLVDLRVR